MKTYLDRYFDKSMSYFAVEKLTNGLVWVAVAEADLRLCCGCPPGTTKYLNKRSLLSEKSGPNAILISDTKVHRCRMISFAEFPVMQMLYMQGMISNAGKGEGLPLVIGMKENVNGQLAYLARGNYGYFTKSELIENGCTEKEAEMYFNIKLWFADGKIFRPKELCKPLYLDDKSHLIRNGVYIQRLGYNFFQIRYKDEKIEIDLNEVESPGNMPFVLDDYEFKRTAFSILHSGEGNGWDPENPCMSSLIINEGKIYAVDAGPGFADIISHLRVDICDLEGIFLTHVHDDHFAGLPDLLKTSKKMKLFSTPLVRYTIQRKFSELLGLRDRTFRQFFEVIDLRADSWNYIDGMEVQPFFSPHPVETNAYMFRRASAAGYKSYAHFADTISLENLDKISAYLDCDLDDLKKKLAVEADVKKVDVGGGFIHGEKADYSGDTSGKLVFSHNSNPSYKVGGKEIYEPRFGNQDILINGNEEVFEKGVFCEIIKDNFPDATETECMEIFAKGRKVKQYHGEIVGQKENELLVILNGNVSCSDVSFSKRIIFDRGHILGLNEFFTMQEQTFYVNSSFVNTLCIDRKAFLGVVGEKASWRSCCEKKKIIATLSSSDLFNLYFRSALIFRLAEQATFYSAAPGHVFRSSDLDDLYVLARGEAFYVTGDKKIRISEGGFFGGSSLLGSNYNSYEVAFTQASEILKISASVIESIPLVLWKIYENCTTSNHLCKTL